MISFLTKSGLGFRQKIYGIISQSWSFGQVLSLNLFELLLNHIFNLKKHFEVKIEGREETIN